MSSNNAININTNFASPQFPRPLLQLVDDQKRIIAFLRTNGSLSRVELAERLNINNGVMTRYTRELISLGLISEGEQHKTCGRGRPSSPLEINQNGVYGVGITVNAGWVDIAIVDLIGQPIKQFNFEFTDAYPESFAKKVSLRFADLSKGINLRQSKFLGFGLSVPGFAKHDASHRHTVERLKDWRGIDLAKLFQEHLGGPVWVENDANAAVLAEYYADKHHITDNILLFYLSHGVGGGHISNGKIFRGAYLNAGEIGGLYPLCSPRPSAIDLVLQMNKENEKTWNLLDLRALKEFKEPTIENWAKRASEQLYLAALSGASWLDPHKIVICGTLPNWITSLLAKHLRNMPWQEALGNRERPQIEASRLDGSAAAIGAAILPIHESISPAS